MRVEDNTIRALATSLNFRQMRQKLLSSNIANAETPGFKARRMDFEQALAQALDVDGQNRLHTEDGASLQCRRRRIWQFKACSL